MTSLSDNPAVADPRRALSAAERDALCAIAFFKQQRRLGGVVLVGNKRFAPSTISKLKTKDLLRGAVPQLTPTLAGQLAIDKLKGENP
ncbi:MAG: hypothetical protein ACK4PN_08570 [Allorhizobium sp.]